MALVQRPPHNPEAIDISAILREEALKTWRRKERETRTSSPAWRRWLGALW